MTLLSHIFNAACGPVFVTLGMAFFLNALRSRDTDSANSVIRSQTLGLFITLAGFIAIALSCKKLILLILNNSDMAHLHPFAWVLLIISSLAFILGLFYFPRFFKTRRKVRLLVFASVSVAMLAFVFRNHEVTLKESFLLLATVVWIAVTLYIDPQNKLARRQQTKPSEH